MLGCDCVSLLVYSILRPRMPPAALISLTASLTPLSKFVPDVVPVPDSSTRPTILTGCASRGCETATLSRKAEIRTMVRIGLGGLRYRESYRQRSWDSTKFCLQSSASARPIAV